MGSIFQTNRLPYLRTRIGVNFPNHQTTLLKDSDRGRFSNTSSLLEPESISPSQETTWLVDLFPDQHTKDSDQNQHQLSNCFTTSFFWGGTDVGAPQSDRNECFQSLQSTKRCKFFEVRKFKRLGVRGNRKIFRSKNIQTTQSK